MAQKINLSAGCSRPRRQLGSILRITLALCICLTLCEAAPEPAKPSCSSPGESCTTASAAATPQYSKHHGDGYGSHKSFRKCLKSISGDPSSPEVVFPGDQDYTASIGLFNPRFQPKPAALIFAESTAQVSAAVQCAVEHGVQVTPSAGRQSFIGASIQNDYLVIDVTRMTSVRFDAAKETVAVGAGISVGLMQSAIHKLAKDFDLPGLMGPTLGSCTWVGVAGFTLGGGFGWLGRYLGLGCDSLVSLKAVLADGSVVTADKDKHAELFWASCGGGGGTFAIVTKLKFKTHILPNDGRVTFIVLKSAVGENATIQAIMDYQAALPTMDHRLGLDGQSIGSGFAGPQFSIVGVFLGSKAEAEKVLEAEGLLKYVDRIEEKDSVYQANLEELAPPYTALPPFKYVGPSPWQTQPWTASPQQQAYLEGLMNGWPVSIVGGFDYPGPELTWWYSQSRLTGIMSEETVKALVRYTAEGFAACENSKKQKTEEGSWYCFLAFNGHSMGGQYKAVSPEATAFVHRDKYWLIGAQFILPAGQSQFVKEGTVAAAAEFARIMDANLEGPVQVYVNYQVPETTPDDVWQRGYFGSNYPRLQRIKAEYDPHNLFLKPQTVTTAS